MDRLFDLSLRYRFFTLLTVILVCATGAWSLGELTIDAVPDLTPVQVQVLSQAPALGPVEVEQFVTFPIETSLSGLPGLQEIRSISRYGLSVVTAIFEDDVDPYLARQLVNERITLAAEQIPTEYARPAMGPLTTGLRSISLRSKGKGTVPWPYGPSWNGTLRDDYGLFLVSLRSISGEARISNFRSLSILKNCWPLICP